MLDRPTIDKVRAAEQRERTDRIVAEIDHALAALVDIKPMADYGEPGTYDTVQARRQRALAQAEQSLLNLRQVHARQDMVRRNAGLETLAWVCRRGRHCWRGLT